MGTVALPPWCTPAGSTHVLSLRLRKLFFTGKFKLPVVVGFKFNLNSGSELELEVEVVRRRFKLGT